MLNKIIPGYTFLLKLFNCCAMRLKLAFNAYAKVDRRKISPIFNCSVSSPWRPHIEDKRMVLEHTHGLFIT
jgi:hypothetical protein